MMHEAQLPFWMITFDDSFEKRTQMCVSVRTFNQKRHLQFEVVYGKNAFSKQRLSWNAHLCRFYETVVQIERPWRSVAWKHRFERQFRGRDINEAFVWDIVIFWASVTAEGAEKNTKKKKKRFWPQPSMGTNLCWFLLLLALTHTHTSCRAFPVWP